MLTEHGSKWHKNLPSTSVVDVSVVVIVVVVVVTAAVVDVVIIDDFVVVVNVDGVVEMAIVVVWFKLELSARSFQVTLKCSKSKNLNLVKLTQ